MKGSAHSPRDRAALVSMWLAVLSLCVLWPDAFNRWVLPKELLLLIAAGIGCFALPRGRLPRGVWITIAAAGGVLLVSAVLADNPLAAFFGRYPRFEGLIALPVYLAAVWLGARLLGPSAPSESRRALTTAASTASILMAFFGALEAFGLRPIETNLTRPGSLLGNASDQGIIGAALAVLLMPTLVAAWSGRDRVQIWLTGAGVVSGVASVVFSVSRAGVLALGSGLLAITIIGLIVVRGKQRRLLATAAAAAAITMTAIVVLVPSLRDRIFGADALAAQTVGDRLFIWRETLGLVAEHPVLGVGPSGFLSAFRQRQGPDWLEHITAGGTLDSPHNIALQIAAAGGIAGLLCALALAVFVVRGAARRIRSGVQPQLVGAVGAVVGIAAALLTHFTGPATGILGGLLIGMLVAREPQAESRLQRVIPRVLLAVWIVLLTLALAGDVQQRAGLAAATAAEADDAFGRAVVLRPWDVDGRSLAAQSLTARADAGDRSAVEPAQRWGAEALAVLPDDRATLLAAGIAARRAGDIVTADARLSHAAQLYPDDPLVLAQFGVTQLMQGDESGLASVERAAEIAPDDAAIGALLEWARHQPR